MTGAFCCLSVSGRGGRLWKRMSGGQIQPVPLFPGQIQRAGLRNLLQAGCLCRSGNQLHLRRMPEDPRRGNGGGTDLVLGRQRVQLPVQIRIALVPRKQPPQLGAWKGDQAWIVMLFSRG